MLLQQPSNWVLQNVLGSMSSAITVLVLFQLQSLIAGANAAGAGGPGRVTLMNQGWLFGGQYTPGSEAPAFSDTSFQVVTIPHSVVPLGWNNLTIIPGIKSGSTAVILTFLGPAIMALFARSSILTVSSRSRPRLLMAIHCQLTRAVTYLSVMKSRTTLIKQVMSSPSSSTLDGPMSIRKVLRMVPRVWTTWSPAESIVTLLCERCHPRSYLTFLLNPSTS